VATSRFAHVAAECFQDRSAFVRRYMQPAELGQPLRAEQVFAAPIGLGARDDNLGGLATAKLEYQPCRDLQPRRDKGRVEPTLEAVAGVAGDFEAPAGRRGADRVEQRRLDI